MSNKKRPEGQYPANSHVRCIYSEWKLYVGSEKPCLSCRIRRCKVDPDEHMCEMGVRQRIEDAYIDKSLRTLKDLANC